MNEAKKLYLELLELAPEHPDVLHYLGLIDFQQGNLDEAERLFKKSIHLNKNPIHLSNYALFAQHQKDYKKSIQLLKNAIELKPDYSSAWFNLGCIYSQLADFESAEEAYLSAIKIDKANIKALFNLASTQEILNKNDEVKLTIEKLLAVKSTSKNHYHTLGLALSRLKGKEYIPRAVDCFKKALTENPESIETYRALASMYVECNSPEKAYELYKKIDIDQLDHRDLSLEYANCLVDVNKVKKAEQIYKKILDKEKNNLDALNGKANVYSLSGKFEDAEIIYKDIIRHDKLNYSAYFGLSNCKKFTEDDVKIFQQLEENVKIKKNSKAFFSLGKIYNDLKDYEKAAFYYKEANELRNKRMDFNREEYTKWIDSIESIFNKKFRENTTSYGNPSELPIFILGAPRSGTTLVEQIIANHEKVFGAGELPYIKMIAHDKYLDANEREKFPEKILNYNNINRDAEIYLDKIHSICNDDSAIRITDKMPGNFTYLGYILSMFPNAKIIHLNRHPVDTCLSNYFQNFNSEYKYSFDIENLIFWYRRYYDQMVYWKNLYDDKILSVNYNDIIDDAENISKLIIKHCNLEWDENCLKHHQSNRTIHTASQWQARQPIYKSSKERWRNYEKYFPELIDGLSDLE